MVHVHATRQAVFQLTRRGEVRFIDSAEYVSTVHEFIQCRADHILGQPLLPSYEKPTHLIDPASAFTSRAIAATWTPVSLGGCEMMKLMIRRARGEMPAY